MSENGDYISRKALFNTVEDYANTHPVMNDNELFALFCSIPAADVRPVVRGRDLSDQQKGNCDFLCSQCGADAGSVMWGTLDGGRFKFCPNCGADMRPEPPKEEE